MSKVAYRGYRFPPEIIQRAVWLYYRFTLSFRDVEELLAERAIEVTYETIRQWVIHFGPAIARDLRLRRSRPHGQWHLDEMFVSICGKWMYLWRAVDAEGDVLDCLVQARRDKHAAKKLMRKLMKKQGFAPTVIVTDHLASYAAAIIDLRLSLVHDRGKRKNNRAESSHVPIRLRERKMRGFKSPGSAQRFLSIHASIYNTFNTCRHLISAANHRRFRAEAFASWRTAVGVAA
jgi:transposase-like protein